MSVINCTVNAPEVERQLAEQRAAVGKAIEANKGWRRPMKKMEVKERELPDEVQYSANGKGKIVQRSTSTRRKNN